MESIEEIIRKSAEVEAKLGYNFKDRSLLALAFIHRSYFNEHRSIGQHNERLEFLGDSVLGLVMADYLYCTMPGIPEGELSYFRSRLVEANCCVSYVNKLNVTEFLLLGKGEKLSQGRGRETILSDLFEAIVGAIFLDGGFEAARQFILKNLYEEIQAILKTPDQNWKALLQDICQKKYQQHPLYKVVSEEGPEHSKVFQITVEIQNKVLGHGSGSSKKIAQQEAAKNALAQL